MRKKIALGFLALLLVVAGIGLLMPDGRAVPPEANFSDPQTIALAQAMLDGDREAVARLVAAGADPNAHGKDGMTLLQWEILREGGAALPALLDAGADPNRIGWQDRTAMHLAAQYRSTRYLEMLLDHGGDANVRDQVMEQTPIFAALNSRRQDNIELLLARGADLALADRNGMAALHQAAAINDFGNVLWFLQQGADPLARNNVGTNFQTYIFMTDPALLNVTAAHQRRQIIDFLQARNIPLDPQALR